MSPTNEASPVPLRKRKTTTVLKGLLLVVAATVILLELTGHDVLVSAYRLCNKFRVWNGKVMYADSRYYFANLDHTIFLYRTPEPGEQSHDAMILEIVDPVMSSKVSPSQARAFLQGDTVCAAWKTCRTRYIPQDRGSGGWQCREAQWLKNGGVVTSGMCFAADQRWRVMYRYGNRVARDSAAVVHTLEKMLS